MIPAAWKELFKFILILTAVATCSGFASSQTPGPQSDSADNQNASEVLKKLDQLVEHNRQLEEQNRELMDQIISYRQALIKQAGSVPEATKTVKEAEPSTGSAAVVDPQQIDQPKTVANSTSPEEEPYKWGGYTPNLGYKIANTDRGDLSVSIYSYARYLNQLGLDATYTDAFGNVKNVQQRQDFQLQKVQIKFLGWIINPKFRYFLFQRLAGFRRSGCARRKSELHVQQTL